MLTVGSICSGIEAASVAWKNLNFEFKWFSEIADFQSRLLNEKYPNVPNLGDMNNIPDLIRENEVEIPDLICGGTPCQAFSYAGKQEGLNDDRGNLTLRFLDVIKENDNIRETKGKNKTIVFWENVEGVLTDKTNAFGIFVSALAEIDHVIPKEKIHSAGLIRGKNRNVAWRILDAKYFGLPQQRRRVYVLSTGKEINPEEVLFEITQDRVSEVHMNRLTFYKEGTKFEIFRQYTDCLYSAYGTKWNGNAAAYNGSLFVSQDNRLRRLSPLECERLMGFPDLYTNINNAKKTQRYQALGNSWSIPVVKWIGERIVNYKEILNLSHVKINNQELCDIDNDYEYYFFPKKKAQQINNNSLNTSEIPSSVSMLSMCDIIEYYPHEDLFLSEKGIRGILRRQEDRGIKMNTRLKDIMLSNIK